MTPEEAIAEIRESGLHGNQVHQETLELALEALEKQIQKKPQLEADGYCDGELVYDTWICPECGEYYEIDYDDYKYCPECGQRIDWSEDDADK